MSTTPGLGRGRLALFALLFMLLSAAVPYTLYQQLDGQPLRLDERWLSIPFLGACAALLLIYFSSDGLRLFFTLKALGYRVAPAKLVPLVFINMLVSNITPMATGGGLAQIWYLRREGVHIGAATAATTLRTLQAVAFIFIPTPFLLLFMAPLQSNPLGDKVALSLALFAVLYLAFFSIVLWRLQWLLAFFSTLFNSLERRRWVSRKRLQRWYRALRREMVRFSRALRFFFKGTPVSVCLASLFTLTFLLSLFSFPALLLWGLGYEISYLTSVGLLLVTTFIMYFSPTPGAAGIAEGVFGLFFMGLVGTGDLLLTIIAWRFLTIHLGMLIGVPFTLRLALQQGP